MSAVEALAAALDADWTPAWHETPIEEPDGHHGEFQAGWDKSELAVIVSVALAAAGYVIVRASGGDACTCDYLPPMPLAHRPECEG